MWRLYSYGGILTLFLLGLLSKNDVFYSRVASQDSWGIAIFGAIFGFLLLLYFEFDLYKKRKESMIAEDIQDNDFNKKMNKGKFKSKYLY